MFRSRAGREKGGSSLVDLFLMGTDAHGERHGPMGSVDAWCLLPGSKLLGWLES